MKGITNANPDDGTVILSKEFFEREPVFVTADKFTDHYYISIRPSGEHDIEVSLQPKNDTDVNKNVTKLFCNELIQQQVRHDLQKRFGRLREMIVEQAFAPLDNK
jgi:His-Xaa-Ser system protein HxsD